MSPNSRSDCRKFAPNIFNKTKCSNCFKQKEEHSAEALECNRAMRKVAKSGYLFVAPGWDFSNPLNRTKRWQRRWFVLYDDGELNYSVDEHPDTVPQASIDMNQVLEVATAEEVTGHAFSLAITAPDRVTFVKAMARDDSRSWTNVLAVYTRNKGRHKRNATFPGGQTTTIHQSQVLPRSGTPNPIRPRYNSCHSDSVLRPATRWVQEATTSPAVVQPIPSVVANTGTLSNSSSSSSCNSVSNRYRDQPASSASPPTRDKLNSEEKAAARIRTRQLSTACTPNISPGSDCVDGMSKPSSMIPDYETSSKRLETLKDIAAVLTRPRLTTSPPLQTRHPPTRDSDTDTSAIVVDSSSSSQNDLRVELPAETLLHLKKGWLMVQQVQDGVWTKLWFVLCGSQLTAYKDPKTEDMNCAPEMIISLSQVASVSEVQVQRNYGFQIRMWTDTLHTLSAVTSGIRSNWLCAVRRAAGLDDLPPRPTSTPISTSTPAPLSNLPSTRLHLSSDEEYRTASEGGRRESLEWAPASPPLTRTPISRVKERARSRSSRSTPSSRASTLDSVSTDELLAVDELQRLHDTLERTERQLHDVAHDKLLCLNQLKEKDDMLNETLEKLNHLNRDYLQKNHANISLQEELNCVNDRLRRGIEENDYLYKKLQELEGKELDKHNSFGSLSDLTNIDLDLDFNNITKDSLMDEYNNLKHRFEKAVQEIRAMKRELRSSHIKYDDLEVSNITLTQDLKKIEEDNSAQNAMMAARIQDLTLKLTASEKQVRNLKSKLQDSREKRRSLSLKGRESFSINKEVEDKITELEAKILSIETDKLKRITTKPTKKTIKRDRSSERTSPVEDRSQRRLRRKSLDSATTSEPMKVLIRLSSLESKVAATISDKNKEENLATSTESLFSNQELKVVNNDETNSRILALESTVETAKLKITDCIDQIGVIKYARRQASSLEERLAPLESTLTEIGNILKSCNNVSPAEIDVINESVLSVVRSFEKLLSNKLTDLSNKRRSLRDSGKLNTQTSMNILAEKLAYESVIISRLHEALNTIHSENSRFSARILRREVLETGQLAQQLKAKLTGAQPKNTVSSKLSEEHLTKLLTRHLIHVGFLSNNNRQISIQQKHQQNDINNGLDYLLDKQKEINQLLQKYKSNKLEQLAYSLALESLNYSADTQEKSLGKLEEKHIQESWKIAQETVGAELVQAEISHVLSRVAQTYTTTENEGIFLTIWAAERAALELWSDIVDNNLHRELEVAASELRTSVKSAVAKLRPATPWRKRLELERRTHPVHSTRTLLQEFADVVAHKALIDARISVLVGEVKSCVPAQVQHETVDGSLVKSLVDSEQYLWLLEDCGMVESAPILAAEFQTVFLRFKAEAQQITEITGPTCEQCEHLKDSMHRLSEEHATEVAGHENAQAQLKERARQLEQRLGTLDSEYAKQLEQLRSAYRETLSTPIPGEAGGGGLRARYQAEIEQLRALCEKGLAAVESSHRRVVAELQEKHRRERDQLRLDKEQALAEETQATLAALDAMRKAHEHEVRREVGKFKADFLRKLQATHDLGALHQEHETEMREIKAEILALSERYSVKCVESASLEEQLCSVHQQLTQAHRHIQQLDVRNKQLAESLATVAAAADEPFHHHNVRNSQLSPLQN